MSSKSSKTDSRRPVVIGTISKVHGLRGAFVIAVDVSMKRTLRAGTVVVVTPTGSQRATPLRLTEVSSHGSGLLVRGEGVDDRARAAALVGSTVSVARDALPRLADAEYYDVDLLGSRVCTDTGRELGTLSDILATGANDVYVVAPEGADEILIAAVAGTILEVDPAAGRIVVDHRALETSVHEPARARTLRSR